MEMEAERLPCYSTGRRWEGKYSPSGFDHFLGDVIEKVPAAEGEGGLQEGQSDLPDRRRPVQGKGHLRSQRLVVPWKILITRLRSFFWWLHGAGKVWNHTLRMLPLQIWTRPTTMMRPRAISFPTVKTSWILVAIRTLEQFTQVNSTERRTHCQGHEPLTSYQSLWPITEGDTRTKFKGKALRSWWTTNRNKDG